MIAFLILAALALPVWAQESFSGSAGLDREIEQAIAEKQFPGAVLVVVQDAKVLHRKAYGQRALEPAREGMTLDTIFDAASLTKVVATTPAIMKLVEQGKVRIAEPVTTYLPEFQGGKSDITVRDLMTHFSGLRPDLDLTPVWSGYETGIKKALIDKPTAPPGQRFVYSDINFELLGEIVRRVSGQGLDQFAREQIYRPLGMNETTFQPAASLVSRIAPTEFDPASKQVLRGVVHDPTARYMGGIAGHAGLFTTAENLMRYAEMFLGQGQRGGVRVFSPLTVQKFTSPASPPDQPILYGLGWDIDSPYSSPRGELFPIGSFGHTGFTGTSLWIDPSSKSYWILLTNRVHPRGGPNISPLRRKLGTMIAAAVGVAQAGVAVVGYSETLDSTRRVIAANHQTLTGLDVLEEEKFAALAGRRVGLITNHTGLDRQGRRNVDVMRAAGVKLTELFSPEHGISGKEDVNNLGDATDRTGLVIHSLYGNSRYRPMAAALRTVDALVFDIQDVGARFYTYSCTMLSAMEETAKAKLPFYVLDRPNPVTGVHVEGPVLDSALQSFVGCYSMPVRHGLTMGELAAMANAERKIGADLHVIKMKNWSRGDWFDSTGLTWVDPSPNMRSLNAATLYTGVALLEASKEYSVGRGTEAPFEQIGAEWIRGAELASFLNARQIPGVRVYATRFTPGAAPLKDRALEGVRFVVTNRELFSSVRFGLEIAYALQKLYPGRIDFELARSLVGSRRVVDAMKAGTDPSAIVSGYEDEVAGFIGRRRGFLLY
jgi:uncharacterized protein YbbC (DUF1343 family)/CubicO group peptidase (beta-lactamase class C family)